MVQGIITPADNTALLRTGRLSRQLPNGGKRLSGGVIKLAIGQ